MIIITGASKGIGKFLFETFQPDESVIRIYRNSIPNGSLENFHQLNVWDFKEVENFVENKNHLLKNITLINCA